MKAGNSNRTTALLLVFAALVSAAFICGRGQRITPQSPSSTSDSGIATQSQPIIQETSAGEIPTEVLPQEEPSPVEPAPENPPQGQGSQADLVISSAAVTPTGSQGEVKVTVNAVKEGNGPVTSSFTIIWKPHAKSDEVGCSWDINAQKINQGYVTKNCTYTYPKHGEMHWSAIIDSENDVGEANENNNAVNGVTIIVKTGQVQPILPPQNCTWRVASVPRIIELGWQYAMPADIDGFRIYMGGSSLVLEVGKTANQASIQNLDLNTQYHFDVRAFKGNNESQPDKCSVDATTGQ